MGAAPFPYIRYLAIPPKLLYGLFVGSDIYLNGISPSCADPYD